MTFDDGQSFALPAELLRVLSPSAEVQGHSEAQRVTVAGKKNVGIVRIEPVGNYAARIVFDDGHDTGLFVWDYLRELGENQEARWQSYLADLAAKRPRTLSSGLRLFGEQRALALDAAAIAGQRPIRPDHAVAGDRHGDWVRGAGAGHGAHRFRRADRLGNLRIARGRADRDAAERVPHAMLKGGAADVEGQVETEAGVVRRSRSPCAASCSKADRRRPAARAGIAASRSRARLVRIVAEENGAYALVARRDQHQAERACADRELDLRVGAAGAELAWGHAEHLR